MSGEDTEITDEEIETTLRGVAKLYGVTNLEIKPGVLKNHDGQSHPWVEIKGNFPEGFTGLKYAFGSHHDLKQAAQTFIWNIIAAQIDAELDDE